MEILNLKTGSKIHFIGIGGVSMSSLAEIANNNGYIVSGSDIKESELTEKLKNSGIKIYIGQKKENIKGPDLVVYTAAISKENEEYIAAVNSGASVIERSVFLGELMKSYSHNCCISGTHGKTTTTAMLSLIMLNAKLDPTILVGGEVKELGSNYKIGSNNILITESCEYVESFLKFYPETAIINNIEEDHLDYFKDLEHIKSSFKKFADLIPSSGIIIANGMDNNVRDTLKNTDNVKYFGTEENCDYIAKNISYSNKGYGSYDMYNKSNFICRINLNVPGEHNVLNSLAAAALALHHNCSIEAIQKGLEEFKGTGRRFEYKGSYNGADIFDDYAHHPTEIKTTLAACKKYDSKNIIAIFQPHTYTRTKALFNDFLTAFYDADELIITDIYAAREKDTGLVNSRQLSDALEQKGVNVKYISNFDDITNYLKANITSKDLVITIGAGDVCKISSQLCQDA